MDLGGLCGHAAADTKATVLCAGAVTVDVCCAVYPVECGEEGFDGGLACGEHESQRKKSSLGGDSHEV